MFVESFGSVELPLGSGGRDFRLDNEGKIPNQIAIPTNDTPIRTPIAEYNKIMRSLLLRAPTITLRIIFQQYPPEADIAALK